VGMGWQLGNKLAVHLEAGASDGLMLKPREAPIGIQD